MSSSNKPLLKKAALKATLLSSSLALILSGCQSTNVHHQYASNADTFGVEHALAFERFDNKMDTQAKSLLLKALAEYYQKERTLSTIYYQKEMPLMLADFEKDSDPVATTFIKLANFSPEDTPNKSAYRSKDNYLMDGDKNLPLLRRYDERLETTPSATVSRQEGMEGDYATKFEEINSLDINYHGCIITHSVKADGLIERKPNLTNEDTAYKNITEEYDDCVSGVNELADEIRNGVKATYQSQDIDNLQMCVTNYRNDMQSILSPNRNARYRSFSGSNGTMDYYSQVFSNYLVCNSLYVTDSKNDPNHYIAEQLTPTQVEMNALVYQCTLDFKNDYTRLVQQGKTQAQNADEYLALQYDVHECFGRAINQTYNLNQERIRPTNLEEVDRYYDEIMMVAMEYEQTLYGDEDSVLAEDYGYTRGSFLRRGFKHYFAMKESEQNAQQTNNKPAEFGSLRGIYMNRFGSFLGELQDTHAQIQAKNWYQYQPSRIQVVSRHVPSQRQFGQIVSFDYQSPTATQSIKVPYLMDFNQGTIKADVAAGMPFVALLGEKYALSPSDFGVDSTKDDNFGVMEFRLPKELEGVIPTAVIYDSLNAATQRAFAEINPQAFSVVAIDGDEFARSVGASRVVRVNLNAKEQGEFLANIAKMLAADLSAYVDANPEKFASDASLSHNMGSALSKLSPSKIKEAIHDWVVINQGFLSRDFGGLVQAIEGVLPISLYQANYYYLDQSGRLVGQVGRVSVDSPMTHSVFHGLSETRIATREATAELTNLMNAAAKDGNQWLQEAKNERVYEEEAERLRNQYRDDQKTKRQEAEQQSKLLP